MPVLSVRRRVDFNGTGRLGRSYWLDCECGVAIQAQDRQVKDERKQDSEEQRWPLPKTAKSGSERDASKVGDRRPPVVGHAD